MIVVGEEWEIGRMNAITRDCYGMIVVAGIEIGMSFVERWVGGTTLKWSCDTRWIWDRDAGLGRNLGRRLDKRSGRIYDHGFVDSIYSRVVTRAQNILGFDEQCGGVGSIAIVDQRRVCL